MAELERLIDEYYEAARGDPRRRRAARRRRSSSAPAPPGIDRDCGIAAGDDTGAALRKLDGFLCELKELQIRDGLHVLRRRAPRASGSTRCWSPSPAPRRGDGAGGRLAAARARRRSRPRRRSAELDLAEPWTGPAGPVGCLDRSRRGPWRTLRGDTVERLEALALRLVCRRAPRRRRPGVARAPRAVLGWIERQLRPAVDGAAARPRSPASSPGSTARFVPPGPSGAPSRGRPEVLPTGRNFYSVDTRAVPTPAAWQLGWHSAGAAASSATPRSTATIRRGSRSRPGAPRTCAPAATTSPRRWR